MDSTWLERRTSGAGENMDLVSSYSSRDYIPAWKMPISKSFSSALSGGEKYGSESGIGSGGERDNSTSSNSDPESCPVEALKRKEALGLEKEEEGQLIQILLPCITCNRTFSPEALERHNRVCTKVNVKTPYKPDRGTFDIAEQRKKGTRVEYFIPPPATTDLPVDNSRVSFSRGSKNRSSLRGTSCTSSTLNSESLSLHQIGLGPITPLRRQRSTRAISQTRGERGHSKTPSEYPYSDSEESQTIPDHDANNLPSYAKPITSTDECPFCNRCFGPKAYDRHVGYCKEKYVQRQYEVQPVPKDKIDAMERQEIRTKYRPMKGSSSCTSLRSVSPGKDFASMAYKLFGLRRSDVAGNLYNNQLTNFKKSNESIANSCYGDYTRGMRRPSPSPSSRHVGNTMSVTNKINNLLSKTFHYQQNPSNNNNSVHPMKSNTTSNIPKLAKSSDNLYMMTGGVGTGSNYAHVSSSGYGPQAVPANNSFNRNSRSRSSLHKNFFRSKRVEPEGTENTGTMTNSSNDGNSSPSPLIITPMSFYAKANKGSQEMLYRSKGTTLLNHDPNYDPYEMAAKQLEELLKAQPINKNVNKKTARKLGLEKAFESVGVHSDNFSLPTRNNNTLQVEKAEQRKSNEDPFVFDHANGKMDDSYWDEILQKSGSSSAGKEKKEQNHMTMSKPEFKSKQSDSNISDSNKSRALSQISSADSGFSRSEVNDAEFEAMESMVGLGEMPQSTMKRQQVEQNPLSSYHPSLRMPFIKRSQSQQQRFKEPESPILSPSPITPTRRDSESVTPNSDGTGARFCHECGNGYPSAVAKFCPECGERRVFKF